MRQNLKAEIYEAGKVLERTLGLIRQDKGILEANKAIIAAFVEDGRRKGQNTKTVLSRFNYTT